jgi:DNA-binding IclR family transcriptional regulator
MWNVKGLNRQLPARRYRGMTAALEAYEPGTHPTQPTMPVPAGPPGAVEKSFVVLEAVAAAAGPLGVSELARQTGLPKSTVHRILAILVGYGLVRRGQDGYQLGRRLTAPVAQPTDRRRMQLRERVVPYLLDLYELTHEAVQLGVLCGAEVLYLDRLYGRRSAAAAVRACAGAPAHDTAIGRVLLAYSPHEVQGRYLSEGPGRQTPAPVPEPDLDAQLARIREQGIAIGHDEPVRGIRSVAAPVLGPERFAVAAIAVTGSPGRIDSRAVLAVRRTAYEAALAIRDLLTGPANATRSTRASRHGHRPHSNGRNAAIARSVTSSTGPVASMPSRMPCSA